jgi:hypothetical protein
VRNNNKWEGQKMRFNLKFKSLTIFLLTALFVCNVSATIVWTGPTGFWADAALWDKGFVPNGLEDIKFTKPATVCTINTDAGDYLGSKIIVVSGPDIAHAAALKIEEGGYLGAAKELVIGSAGSTASGNIGYLLQTGGELSSVSTGKIEIGYKTFGQGYYTMTGGSLTGDGTLFVGGAGAAGASGTFTVVGTDPVINMRKIYVGAKDSTGAYAGTGTIDFEVGASGVSPIRMSSSIYLDPMNNEDSIANLIVNLTAAPPTGDILLLENTGSSNIHGKFDFVNGIAAAQGTSITLNYGGINYLYNLTYLFDAAGDGYRNDIALMAIPEPATMAFLALGGLFSIIKLKS